MSWSLPMSAPGECSGVLIVDAGFETSWSEYVVSYQDIYYYYWGIVTTAECKLTIFTMSLQME